MRHAPVAEADQDDFVLAWIEDAERIPLELLSVLEPLHQSVAVVGFESQPLLLFRILWRQASCKIDVVTVASDDQKTAELRAKAVSGSQVQRMIALKHIERAAVCCYAAQPAGDKYVGVSVPIPVRVGGEVVCDQVTAYRNVLGDRFAVVAGYAGHKVLRRLDTA
jgi:hypothetical protein